VDPPLGLGTPCSPLEAKRKKKQNKRGEMYWLVGLVPRIALWRKECSRFHTSCVSRSSEIAIIRPFAMACAAYISRPTFSHKTHRPSLLHTPHTNYGLFLLLFFLNFIMPPMGDRGPSPLRPPTTLFRIESLISPIDREHHPVIHAGRVAVITGAASGIGRAAASELAR
jgi:hypothetical protein